MLKRTFFSSLNNLGTLVENQLTIEVRLYSWDFNSILLVYMSVLLKIPPCFTYFHFEPSFKSGFLETPYGFQDEFFISVKEILLGF